MFALNKERAAFLAAIAIAAYGLAGAFPGTGGARPVPDIPPMGRAEIPPMTAIRTKFLENSFDYYWGEEKLDVVRDPWVAQKTTAAPTPEDFPMAQPELAQMPKVVPAPPFSPAETVMPVIWQYRPPVNIEQAQPQEGAK